MLALVALVALFFYICIFAGIHEVDKSRLSYIRDKIADGETEIEIIHFPYESYLWAATPTAGSIWEERYKLFYGIPEEIVLRDVWMYSD